MPSHSVFISTLIMVKFYCFDILDYITLQFIFGSLDFKSVSNIIEVGFSECHRAISVVTFLKMPQAGKI